MKVRVSNIILLTCLISLKEDALSSVGISETAINVNSICFSPSLS